MYKISWLEYSGYDCSGHYISTLYNGTKEEALRYAHSNNEGTDGDINIEEFDLINFHTKKGPIF
jgi:predicted 3-demethylubiquinone-9 3-methyltransferase (glyoxalase superfamily)